MGSIDVAELQTRVRLAYEWSRMRRALLGFLPAAAVIALSTWLASRPASALMFGVGLFLVGVSVLWYGRDLRRAVLPGFVAGLVPLTLATCANHVGHLCTGENCMLWCVPACTVGGLAAGLAISVVGYRGRRGLGFWVAASAISLLTGAMGCSCAGYAGVLGLALGFGAGLVPGFARRLGA